MGKITRKPQEKHKSALSPAVQELAKQLSTAPYSALPGLFDGWSQRWPYPRGDLYHWVEALDRFDEILQAFNTHYGLDKGSQTIPFDCSLLLRGSPGMDESRLKELGFGVEGDRELIEAILVFSKLLVEKCANRALYNSTERLNDIFNTTSLSLLHKNLRITFILSQRYGSVRPPPHAIKFYDFDTERIHKTALPLSQTVGPNATIKRGPPSPIKTKGKDKTQAGGKGRRGSVASNPNDFRSLVRDTPHSDKGKSSTAAPDRDWLTWAHVKVSWTPPDTSKQTEDASSSEPPSTPTPSRQTPSRLSASTPVGAHTMEEPKTNSTQSSTDKGLRTVELSPSDLTSTTIENILRENQSDDMPASTRYDLLCQLRVAYGLIGSTKSRQDLLAIRLLSISSLANVVSEPDFSLRVFATEKPQDFAQQLASLLQDTKRGHPTVPLYLQTLAMEAMSFLSHCKPFATELTTILGAGSSQGLLSQMLRQGLDDISKEQKNDPTDTIIGDEWREAVFSMPITLVQVAGHHGRSSDAVIATAFVSKFMTGLSVTTDKALRVHLKMLDFVKTFFHHFKDGLTVLLSASAFEVISNLFGTLVGEAWSLLNSGKGIPVQYKTRATDYEIPYTHQQIIRSIVDMFNDIANHNGTQADRVLRSLVDSQALLRAFRLIIDHLRAFGTYTWGEAIKALCGFLHNEPTSYTVISEAGIIQSFLDVLNPEPKTIPRHSQAVSSIPENRPQGIPPISDTIINVCQAFGAICLTTTGFDSFTASGALEKFFEVFESPAHVKVLSDPNVLSMLGSTFDELVRHHPNLRESVLSAVTIMLARVRHISRSLSVKYGAGVKLWRQGEGKAFVPCGGVEALSTEILPPVTSSPDWNNQRTLQLPNGVQLVLEDEVLPPCTASLSTISNEDSEHLKASDYARPAMGFLMTFFEHQPHCMSFMDYGGCDIILDFITLPSLAPLTSQLFDRHAGMFLELVSAVHMMAECKPQLVLPALIDRARYACQELQQFCQNQPKDWSSYFGHLAKLPSGDTAADNGSAELTEAERNGTHVLRSLLAVFCLAQALSELFHMPIYNQRGMQNNLFGSSNLEDVYVEVVKSMGVIASACYREDVALQRALPERWLAATRPAHFANSSDEVDQLMSVRDNGPRTNSEHNTDAQSDVVDFSKEKLSPTFANVQTLRFLLVETPSAITEFISRLGRNVAPRRRQEALTKQKTAAVTHAIATACLTQLQPAFLDTLLGAGNDSEAEPRFTYFVLALDNIRRSFYDDIAETRHQPAVPSHSIRQGFVVEAFRRIGGVQALAKIGDEFFEKLKSCKVEHAIFTANTGLKICLDILSDFTDTQNIMNSAQSKIMANADVTKAFYFVPGQVLLNLRMEALPLTRRIWESEYADQASKDVVQKLVSILKHALTGDAEDQAIQKDDARPVLAAFVPKRLTSSLDSAKLEPLVSLGFDEELAREALYRTNSTALRPNGQVPGADSPAIEYCRALGANRRRRRLPLLDYETSSNLTSVAPDVRADIDEDDEMEDVDSASEIVAASDTANASRAASSTMNITNLLNVDTDIDTSTEKPSPSSVGVPLTYSVEAITQQRDSIRDDLADRCNNILSNHQNLTFELCDLIKSATEKVPAEATKEYWKATSDLLVTSLLSMQPEEDIDEGQGKKIFAAAHLVALLIKDDVVFQETVEVFQESFEGLLSFLTLPAANGKSEEGSYPWVAPVLLIVEMMLSRDCEPAVVQWNRPGDLESSSEAVIQASNIIDMESKIKLFDALVNLLPRVGKDKGMALAITRVLVALTRTRDIATRLADKRNLQRLFLMVKQLANGVGHRLQSSLMLTLRHIVEDDDTLRQIMRSEIKTHLTLRNSARNPDPSMYVRDLHHLALRSPSIFVEVSNEMVKLSSWSSGSRSGSGSSIGIVLRDGSETPSTATESQPQASTEEEENKQPAESIEKSTENEGDGDKSKTSELKAPVVEHPDGVIHFILSELLNYKDVEDKEVSLESSANAADGKSTDQVTGESSSHHIIPSTDGSSKPSKFKPEDHPIFSYRCFLMYSLTELLHSYNRTKVEFINFSRKADPMAVTPSKPRSGILNYFLNGLIPSSYVDREESLTFKKKMLTSDWAIRVIVALCSKTGEVGSSVPPQRYSSQPQVEDDDNEPDLVFVRRFVLEHAIKAYKDGISSAEPLPMKYSRLLCFADMFNRLLSKPTGGEGSAGTQNHSYKVLARMMFEKNLISILSSSLAEIDLAYAGSRRVIKFILRPLQELTTLATSLSVASPDMTSAVTNVSDDVISSASSVSDADEDREETPDLFRNSALGMLDPNHDPESDTDEDEDEQEDEDMYEEEYEDEMEYENGLAAGGVDDEAVSDEDEDDGLGPDGPIEGLPGDIPMDIEFVVNGPEMDVDSDDEDEDDSEESEDEDDDEEEGDGEDFEIGEDHDHPGEINGDDENDSLNDGGEEAGWEDEAEEDGEGGEDDDEEPDSDMQDQIDRIDELEHAEFDFDGDIMHVDQDGQGGLQGPAVLDNLLRVLDDHDMDRPVAPRLHQAVIHADALDDALVPDNAGDGEEDEDEDEDEDGDEMDENDDVVFGHDFDGFLGHDPLQLPLWDGQPPIRRHRNARHGGWFSRRFGGRDDLAGPGRSGRMAHGRGGVDSGMNPLLRRPEQEQRHHRHEHGGGFGLPLGIEAMPGMGAFPPLHTAIQAIDGHNMGGHGAVLDALFQAIQRGDVEGGQVRLRMPGAMLDAQNPWRAAPTWHPRHHGHITRDESQRTANFVPAVTVTRWAEEARLLFGDQVQDKLQRVQLWVMSVLVPLAQREEKERQRKREEEQQAEREETERLRIEAERRQKEQEEREEQERLRLEAEAAEAAAAAAANQTDQDAQRAGDAGEADAMEGVEQEANNSAEQNAEPAGLGEGEANAEDRPRIFTTIRGRQLDITGLDIDHEYLEALPEELREEVIMQQYATRREEARQEGNETSAGIDPDFLNALPEEIREEIRQQEAHAQRRREREEARRQAAAAGAVPAQAEEMDNDNFLATLDPAFRRVILAEQPPEILRQLDPRHAAEGRAHARRLYQYVRGDGQPRDDRQNDDAAQRDSKRQIVQMVDKSGVATLLRLMFLPQQGSLRTNLWLVLRNICGNRQTRSEVVSLLLIILKEGSVDVTAVERSLANLSLRAKASGPQKTPQQLKRTLSMPANSGISDEVTPLVVVQQCLSALKQLCTHNYHARTLFVRESDTGSLSKKGKGKAKESKTTKYPINDLLGLLDRKLIIESSTCLQSLAELLSTVTQALPSLLKKEKEKDSSEERVATGAANQAQAADPAANAAQATAQDTDVVIQDAPAPASHTDEDMSAPSASQQPNDDTATGESSTNVNGEATPDESKTKKIFEPPEIDEHNLQLVVGIFVAPECNSDTFHSTLDTLSSLSAIPGTSEIFSRELIHHIKELSVSICKDLGDLIPQLKDAQSTTDIHGISSTKFSHSGSDQVKLLRVLQALDYLSAPKSEPEDAGQEAVAKSILSSSYEELGLRPLWTRLSECLTNARDKENMAGFANILLPLIESLMVVCKNTSLKDSVLARQLREQAPGSPVPEDMDDLQELFFNFTTEHRKILNDIIRQSPKLMQGNGSFSLLVKNPKVLDFDNKRAYFTKQIHSRLHQQRHIQPPLQLNVRRDQVFLDSYKALYYKSAEEMKYGKLNIRFNGEEGVDAGGVTREWFQVLARGMFNPDWALWQPVAADRTTFHPSPLSWINGEHLLYFKFIGRIIGKALHEGRVLDCHFSRAVYKRLLGKEPNLKDLESMDLDYYKSLVWILENDITDVITEDFSVIEEQFGEEKVIDLIPDGRNIPVTDENKQQYVNEQVRYRLTTSVKDQIENFVKGFHDIIPAELVAIFDEQELELLISGLPEIDVDDWRAHTEYHNYNVNSPQITWFWRVVRGMSNEERAKLLQFVTGTSKVPLNGFKDLEGMQGNTLFSIHK
jgi:E3 ubiquitin-protein ligase HUWE1